MELLEKIKSELSAFEQTKRQLIEELRNKFPGMFSPLFEKYPQIESVSWRQYTPYFNDGDPCEFRARVDDIEVNGKDLYDFEEYASSYYREKEGRESNELEKGVEAFIEVLTQIPDDFYKDLFGDHVMVTIKNNEIEVEEYEHD